MASACKPVVTIKKRRVAVRATDAAHRNIDAGPTQLGKKAQLPGEALSLMEPLADLPTLTRHKLVMLETMLGNKRPFHLLPSCRARACRLIAAAI